MFGAVLVAYVDICYVSLCSIDIKGKYKMPGVF